MKSINQALLSLDPSNDDHWTSDGSPKMEAVAQFLDQEVTRKDIIQAAPEFNRTHAMSLKEQEDDEDRDEQEEQGEPEVSEEEDVQEKADEAEETQDKPVASAEGWCPDELLNKLRRAQEKHAHLENLSRKAQDAARAANDEVAKLEEEIEKHRPRHSDQEQIMKYIRNQNEQRAKRAGQVIQTKVPRSKLDQTLNNRKRPPRSV